MSVLVSVIIPCYNCSKTIRETLLSVLNQTYPNVEIICVNDGSSDSTQQILEQISSEFPDKINIITVLNGGGSRARNIGFNASAGEVIQYLDADDCLSLDKIASQMSVLESNIDMVVSDYEQRDYLLQKVLNTIVLNEIEASFINATINKIISTPNPIYRRELIKAVGGYREDLAAAQDWDFHLRLTVLKPRIKYLPKIGVYTRAVENSVSAHFGKVIICCGISLIDLEEKIFNEHIDLAVKQRIARYYYEASLHDTDKARVKKYLVNLQKWDKNLMFLNSAKQKIAKLFGLKFVRFMDKTRISFGKN